MKRRDSASAIAVVWSDQAGRDLDAIGDFIALDDPVVAVQWIERLVDAAERLAHAPRMGRKVPEFGREDVRELIRGNYRMVYRVAKERVEVLTVFEGHRLLKGPP